MTESKKFYLSNGNTFSTLKGLAIELKDMAEDVYNHHVCDEKNDFASWTKNSLKKDEFATLINRQITRVELELEVLRHIVHEESKKKSKKKPIKKGTKKKTISKK